EANKRQQTKIAKLAQVVLDARKQFPGSSLADLYDPLTMPPVLLEAHQNLDREVMRLYGFPARMAEAAVVARLFELYQNIVDR
ncbi:type IIL restriction-modification enzyme MmeI, partial [Desulfovibrio sp.]